MVVLRNGINIYFPKFTIRACLVIDRLFGDVIAPLSCGSIESQVIMLALSLEPYGLTEDELYDLIDTVEDLQGLIFDLYKESGIIGEETSMRENDGEEQGHSNSVDRTITFESHMNELLKQCMVIGMREDEFYSSTIEQVNRYVESYHKAQEERLQERAYFDYQLANLIGMSVSRLMSKNAKYPEFKQAYPFLNKEARKEETELWEIEKQCLKMKEWAEQMNKKFENQEKE